MIVLEMEEFWKIWKSRGLPPFSLSLALRLPSLSVFVNCLIWNCRGAGGKSFTSLIKDYLRIYNLHFVAILEPCISGDKAKKVIERIGLDGVAKVDAMGFSGGLWCLWNHLRLHITPFLHLSIVSISRLMQILVTYGCFM